MRVTPYMMNQLRRDVRGFMTAMTEQLSVTAGAHDQAAELVHASRELMALARELQERADARVVDWLAANVDGCRAVTIGERRFYAHRATTEKLLDVQATAAALARISVAPTLADAALRLYGGDVVAAHAGAALWGEFLASMVGGFAASFVSSGGLKKGACKDAMGDAFGKHWTTTRSTERTLCESNAFTKGRQRKPRWSSAAVYHEFGPDVAEIVGT